jgi:PKD repeat protein
VQVIWNFGDGGTAVGQSASHVYTAAGTYSVFVSATVAAGVGGSASTTTTATITGTGQTGTGLSAGGPYSGQVGQLLTLTGSLFTATPGVIDWLWNFGDGTTGSGQSVQKAYTAPGTYTVTLQARMFNQVPLTATTTVTIGGAPITGATEQIQLFSGCNNIALTWPSGTAITVVVSALSPSGTLLGIWRFDNVGQRASLVTRRCPARPAT